MENNKGFTIVELLIALLVIGIVSVLVTSFLSFGYEAFNVNSRYTAQQEKIQQAVRLLRKDINECKSIEYNPSTLGDNTIRLEILKLDSNPPDTTPTKKVWQIKNGKLQYYIEPNTIDLKVCVDGLYDDDSVCYINAVKDENKVILSVKPLPANTGKLKIDKSLITEFSVKYKIK